MNVELQKEVRARKMWRSLACQVRPVHRGVRSSWERRGPRKESQHLGGRRRKWTQQRATEIENKRSNSIGRSRIR